MIIRDASPEDLPDILKVLNDDSGVVTHTPYTYWVILDMSDGVALVAIEGRQVVGFIGGFLNYQPAIAFLWQIVVASSYRRHGVGVKLVERFLQITAEANCPSTVLTISPDNKESQAFFEGFVQGRNSRLEKIGDTGNAGGALDLEEIWTLTRQ